MLAHTQYNFLNSSVLGFRMWLNCGPGRVPILRYVMLDKLVKPVLSGHLKRDKIKFLMENGSLIKVKGIAECSNTFDLN